MTTRDGQLEKRRFRRYVPVHPVEVAAEAERMSAVAGEALNLSEGGACLALKSAEFTVGDEVILWLRSSGGGPRVPATARVVWAGPGEQGRPRYGVEWTHLGPQRSWLRWLARV
jgi:hypothetical protein